MLDYLDRIRNKNHLDKIMTADEAALLINPGDKIGMSGFSPAGYAKAVPLALAKRMEKTPFQVEVWTGGSVGPEIDTALSKVNGISRRLPYQSNADIRGHINKNEINYCDVHVSLFPQQIRYGYFGKMNVGIVEAIAITEEGNLIPSTSVGISPTICSHCDKIIVELNVTKPLTLEGMHDVYEPADPPYREPIPLKTANDRIGTIYIPCGWDKIAAIVPTDIEDKSRSLKASTPAEETMGKNIVEFLKKEVAAGRLTNSLLPIQSGVGSVANAVIKGLSESEFSNMSIFTEVLQDGVLDLIENGKANKVSTCCLSLTPAGLQRFYDNIETYKKIIVFRPQEISNNPELIRRLGAIAINTAVEVDIFGCINSTHILGSRVFNGIGGSGDFTRAGFLNVFCTSSIAKNGDISAIVPMCAHIDHGMQDTQIIVTEQGVADLRGLSPVERAHAIIENCAHPSYRAQLLDYLNRALEASDYHHKPVLLDEALSWHDRFQKTGTMRDPQFA